MRGGGKAEGGGQARRRRGRGVKRNEGFSKEVSPVALDEQAPGFSKDIVAVLFLHMATWFSPLTFCFGDWGHWSPFERFGIQSLKAMSACVRDSSPPPFIGIGILGLIVAIVNDDVLLFFVFCHQLES